MSSQEEKTPNKKETLEISFVSEKKKTKTDPYKRRKPSKINGIKKCTNIKDVDWEKLDEEYED